MLFDAEVEEAWISTIEGLAARLAKPPIVFMNGVEDYLHSKWVDHWREGDWQYANILLDPARCLGGARVVVPDPAKYVRCQAKNHAAGCRETRRRVLLCDPPTGLIVRVMCISPVCYKAWEQSILRRKPAP